MKLAEFVFQRKTSLPGRFTSPGNANATTHLGNVREGSILRTLVIAKSQTDGGLAAQGIFAESLITLRAEIKVASKILRGILT